MAYGFTRTLPVIAGSHDNFPVVLTSGSFPASAINGGGTSILNGGGNLRAYTDDTKLVQLPVEIVLFVTGVNPSIVVHVKIPVAETGSTIYIEADTESISQPAIASTYGRNAVWSDYEFCSHDGVIDSSGNHAIANVDVAVGGSVFGEGLGSLFNGVSSRLDHSQSATKEFNISAWVNPLTLGREHTIGAAVGFLAFSGIGIQESDTVSLQEWASGSSGAADSLSVASLSQWQHVSARLIDLTSRDIYLDGVVGTSNQLGKSWPNNGFRWGNGGSYDTSTINGFFDGDMCEMRLRGAATSEDFIITEHDNQSSPDSWGTSSAWAEQVATGINVSVTEVLKSFTEASTANISYNVELTVTETLGAFTENSTVNIENVPTTIVVNETLSSLIEASVVDIDVNINAIVTETLNSFLEGSNVTIAKDIDVIVTENLNGFQESSSIQFPITITFNPKNTVRVKRQSNTVRVKRNSNIVRVK